MRKIIVSLQLTTALALSVGAALSNAQGLSAYDDVNAPVNSTRLMPNAPRGSEYPTHGNQQAGEMNLNPTDPRAQLVTGTPNNAQSGGYGSPLAGVRSAVPPGQ
ncbi:hypothetical protein SAMN04487926_13146 [Paraburkholderia steynii]|uniref:Uncharacterized protein n=1 Tax=Paraburkholderia steynii TaxID=1245441 RepID=A0A7Z7BEL0_9BURK|nr:hypothetical protein SAMN04487926_13146 [Paraburkholderia steynii]